MPQYLYSPTTVAEAVSARQQAPEAVFLAGGTELIADQNRGVDPKGYISLRGIAGLTGIDVSADRVSIGALTTIAELKRSAALADGAAVLTKAARSLGSRQVRNRATVGGNIGAGGPERTLIPALLVLDAQVDIEGAGGRRTAALADIITPDGTELAPDEILTTVHLAPVRGPQSYFRIGARNAVCFATVALALVVDEDTRSLCLGLGGVAPTAVRAATAESLADRVDWDSRTVSADVAQAFGAAAADDSSPVSDPVATAEYRRHATGVMARRALQHAFEEDPA
ncbi:MAG: FAD binding domain-containing protein [Candidatus Nanopelagicales bacterium]